MKSCEFVEITKEVSNTPIEGITLELSGRSNVTLDKCLFEDYE